MTVYRYWRDFLIHPGNAECIKTREERLNISNAVDMSKVDLKDAKAANAAVNLSREKGAIAPKDIIITEGDEFEALEITDYGQVTIWTKQKVWQVLPKYSHDPKGYEKLFFMRRNPPE